MNSLCGLHDGTGVVEEMPPSGGWRGGSGGTDQKSLAECEFQSLDTSAECGLGDVEMIGGGAEVALVHHGEERAQVLDVHGPSMRSAGRCHRGDMTHETGTDVDLLPVPEAGQLRVLFCIGVLPDFYAQPAADLHRLLAPFGVAFNGLGSRFGIRVLGTLDDVHLQSGSSLSYPWTCYIPASAPGRDSIRQVVDQLMTVEVDGCRLWRFAKIEARVGVPLDFGTC